MNLSAPFEKSKSLGSGGSMVARLKLKGIDGRAPPGAEPAALRLNLSQMGKLAMSRHKKKID